MHPLKALHLELSEGQLYADRIWILPTPEYVSELYDLTRAWRPDKTELKKVPALVYTGKAGEKQNYGPRILQLWWD